MKKAEYKLHMLEMKKECDISWKLAQKTFENNAPMEEQTKAIQDMCFKTADLVVFMIEGQKNISDSEV